MIHQGVAQIRCDNLHLPIGLLMIQQQAAPIGDFALTEILGHLLVLVLLALIPIWYY